MSTEQKLTLAQIKREKQITIDSLFETLGVFFAFSNQQFEESKTPLLDGDKYVRFASGSYIPKSNYSALEEGFSAADDLMREKIKANSLEEDEVLYELNNHECFYTGSIDDAMDVLGEDYSREYVREVYFKHRDRYNDDCGYAIN
jgi:hypothetical protein